MTRHMTVCVALVVPVIAGFVLAAASPRATAPGFSLNDVRGRDAFFLTGEATAGPILGPVAAVRVIEADGNGNFPFATRTINIAGQVVIQNDEATGTYTVNPDGTGSAIFFPASGAPAETFDFTIVDKKLFHAVPTGPGVVGYGTATR